LYFIFECSVINDGKFINNEFNDVYLVTTVDPIPLEAFTLQVRKCVLFILLWWVLVCVNTCFIYYRLVLIKDQFGEYDLFMLESFLFSCTFRLFQLVFYIWIFYTCSGTCPLFCFLPNNVLFSFEGSLEPIISDMNISLIGYCN